MSREGAFLVYCLEVYRAAKGASGRAAVELFERFGVTGYVMRNYQALHTEGEQYLVRDIDRFIANCRAQAT